MRYDYIKCTIEPVNNYTSQEFKDIRLKCKMSIAKFSQVLGVTTNAVEKWEDGSRIPSGATIRLYELIDKNPNILIDYNIITPLIEGDRY